MKTLHIVQGGITNGDLEWLKDAASTSKSATWVVPKSAEIGDEVVVYVTGYGFLATASIATQPKPRTDWVNRYGARITGIRLIRPPISLDAIRAELPSLTWARYPRSITTPADPIVAGIRAIIASRHAEFLAGSARSSDEDIKNAARQLASVDATTREALIQARRGQGLFRQLVMEHWQSCAISGCGVVQALRASHIKPWRDCSNEERLDPYNGLLLVGTLDLLFDAGLISFADSGKVLLSPSLPRSERGRLGLRADTRLRQLERPHLVYLKWHRDRVFARA